MATKKMKKFKRYEEGGEVTVDEPKTRRISFNPDGSRTQSFAEQIASRQQTGGDQAAFKKSGLEASNKEKPVGFFERLRMGNIDEVGTEAYNRLGAGRGRTSAPVPAPTTTTENRPQITARIPPAPRTPTPNEESGYLQNMISSGSDFKGRPQDEGYRPNKGTATERAMLEGAYDSGKITESGDQGFGGPGSSRVVKAMSTALPKDQPAPKKPAYVQRYTEEMMEADNPRSVKAEKAPAAKPKPAAEVPSKGKSKEIFTPTNIANQKAAVEKVKGMGSSIKDYLSNIASPRERQRREKEKSEKGYASGGSVRSASNRGDGIAQRGKTRGKIC